MTRWFGGALAVAALSVVLTAATLLRAHRQAVRSEQALQSIRLRAERAERLLQTLQANPDSQPQRKPVP